MKIIQVISYFYPAWSYGGPGKLVFDLSKGLVKDKNSLSIFSTDAFNAARRRYKTDNSIFRNNSRIKKYFFPNISNSLAYKSKIFLTLPNLTAIIRDIRSSDIVHIHEFFTPLALIFSYLSKIIGKPYLLSAHGTLDSFHLSHRKFFKNIFMRTAGKYILKNSSGLIAATDEEDKEYQNLGVSSDKVYHVDNGIDFSNYEILPSKGFFRKKNGISSSEKIIIFLGRINKLKGLDLLIDSYARLVKDNIKVKLVIAGSDDGYLEHIRDRVSKLKLTDLVLSPGILAGKEKIKTYVDCDLFVYPSPAEGFSIAILEAAACGLPLLITEGCKFPEVEKCRSGLVVPYHSESFYLAMKKILFDDKYRSRLARNARELVREKYTVDSMTDRLTGIYKKIILSYDRH